MHAERSPILITGVGQRLGLRLAERFLAEGQPVIGTYRTRRPAVDRLEQLGAVCLPTDLGETQDILALIDAVRCRTDRLRAIIHNASDWAADAEGVAGARVFQQLFQVHMQAPYLINLGCRSLLEAAASERIDSATPNPEDDRGQLPPPGADIVHLTDHVATRGSARHAAYAASKAGLENLTRSFAALFAPHIKVNAIAPALLAFNKGDDDAYRKRARSKSVLGRVPGFDAGYDTVRFLLDSPYITGAVIPLDGGRAVRSA